MKKIYTYGGQPAMRNLTMADLQANKGPHRFTLTCPCGEEEAADCEEAGIDIVSAWDIDVDAVRRGAPNTFMVASQAWDAYVTHDEILRAAITALSKGADCIYTVRGLDVVEMLANQGIAVQSHLGLVPRRSTRTNLRPIGKTADEALALLEDFRRLEDAGGVMAEVELVPQQAMEEISKRTPIVTVGIGSGTGCDVIFQFIEDLAGDADSPRHARAYADLKSLRQKIRDERRRAIKEWKDDSLAGTYPGPAETVYMPDQEYEKFMEALD